MSRIRKTWGEKHKEGCEASDVPSPVSHSRIQIRFRDCLGLSRAHRAASLQ